MFPAIAMLKVIGLIFMFLLDAIGPSFFHEASIQMIAYFGPKFWGVGMHIYIYIYAVKLLTGPSLAFLMIINWSK